MFSSASHEGGLVTSEKDPCSKEAALSMKCLEKNNCDKAKCHREFNNYTECKTFWMKVRFERRSV